LSATYVVTGANRGIGLELCRRLSARGEEVIGTARDPEAAEELRELGIRIEALDVADPESVERFARHLEEAPVDVLVNNAGAMAVGNPIDRLELDELDELFRINSIGPLRVTQALLHNLRAGGRKQVVHITSKMGSIDDNTTGGYYAYRSSKAALNMINRSLALDLKDEGFTCIVLHPGWVRTRMGGDAAPLTVEESVEGMLRVLDGLEPADSGRFIGLDGEPIPW